MDKDKLGLKDMDPQERILVIAITALSVVIFVLAVLQLIAVWEESIKVYVPLMAVMMLLQAKLSWAKNRKLSKFYVGVAIFLLLCAVLVIFFG